MKLLSFYRWYLIIVGFLICLILGTVYAWSVFRPPLHKPPYNVPIGLSSLPFSVFLMFHGLTMVPAGRILVKKGPRYAALIGTVLIGLGYVLSYTIFLMPESAIWFLIFTFGILIGTGTSFVYNPVIAVTGQWFLDKRGLALGLTVMGFGLSALITAPLIDALINALNVSITFLILGICYFIILSGLCYFLKFPSEQVKVISNGNLNKSWINNVDFTPKEVLKTSTFYLVWIVYAIGAGAGLAIIGYAKLIAMDITGLRNNLEYLATFTVSILAIGNASGRPIMGKLADVIGSKRTIIVMQLIQFLCLLFLFPNAKNIIILYIASFLFGGMFGAYLAVMPTLTSYFYGTKYLGPNYGMLFTAYGIGGLAISTLMSMIIKDKSSLELYSLSFYYIAALLLIALFLTLLIKPPKIIKRNV